MFPVSPQTQKPELHQEVLAIACPSFHRAVILYVSKMLRPQGSLGRTELHCCRRGQDMVRTWQGAGFTLHLFCSLQGWRCGSGSRMTTIPPTKRESECP